MDKDTRTAIERATQKARKLLEEDFAAQLEGDFDVHGDGKVAAKAGKHLSAYQAFARERIVAAIEHKRAAGMSAADAARDYLRDAAFTTLNRFVALKMLEARELVQECITKGEQSGGYREFCGMAPGLPLLPESAGYRLYIESLFDELSTEVKVLFERRDPSSVLWPKRATFEQLLEVLNVTDLSKVWGEDETIGWVYQFFNSKEERAAMRDVKQGGSQAPRNSRELAVRNQFFTPRYVVQFLTDNTLGRIWYEMRGTKTVLVDQCGFLVRKPSEEFAPRKKKDPRDLRVLDPACGSGHFLLYAFDLLLAIYEEAYVDPESPKSEATGRTLAEDYPSLDALKRAVPGLVLAHNLHGVDIDSRCAQIAQLALWMRVQKAYRDFGIGRGERAQIRRSNIIVAEPLVADDQTTKEFVAKLGDAELGRLFTSIVQSLNIAGDLGLLLKIETLVKAPVRKQGELFAPAEERLRAALDRFMREETTATNTTRRLFADDAAQGVALLEVAEKKFDVTLMNPPFGDSTISSRDYLASQYSDARLDLYACFVESALSRAARGGRVGVLSSRLGLFLGSLEKWRERALMGVDGRLEVLADLGHNVLDDALVEAAAYVIRFPDESPDLLWASGLLDAADKASGLTNAIAHAPDYFREGLITLARELPGKPIPYWLPSAVTKHLVSHERLSAMGSRALVGIQTDDDFRFVRLAWECPPCKGSSSTEWRSFAKGGEYSPYYDDIHLVINWTSGARELRAYIEQRYSWTKNARSATRYGDAGLTYPERTTSEFSPRPLPSGSVFSIAGPSILSASVDDSWALLALFYTRWYRLLIEAYVGGGDAVQAGSAARHYKTGILNVLPLPRASQELWVQLVRIGRECALARAAEFGHDETSRVFAGFATPRGPWDAYASEQLARFEEGLVLREILSSDAEALTAKLFELGEEELRYLREQYGPHPSELAGKEAPGIVEALNTDYSVLCRDLVSRRGYSRQATKLSHWTEKRFETVAHCKGVTVSHVVAERQRAGSVPTWWSAGLSRGLLSYWVGIAFGRWLPESEVQQRLSSEHLMRLPSAPFAAATSKQARAVLVDDDGHPDDICAVVLTTCPAAEVLDQALTATESNSRSFRTYLRHFYFDLHLTQYSKSRRKAPIYWQLATPSASYSVWLYIHAFSKDTLFRVQNDYVAPKLAHEERRLESVTSEMRDGATAAPRKQLATQEALVEELRAFLDEVKRVAPLWKPNLEDGVVINFAPLWRLVPQHKAWQKELKSTWDALAEGKYDWAQLAMHLWPERVVPKCAEDRSLAIAHGLEDVFWVEGTDDKWTARNSPTKSVDDLVKERTSPAVKSALKSLREAPVASGKNTGRKGGARLKDAVAEGGYD